MRYFAMLFATLFVFAGSAAADWQKVEINPLFSFKERCQYRLQQEYINNNGQVLTFLYHQRRSMFPLNGGAREFDVIPELTQFPEALQKGLNGDIGLLGGTCQITYNEVYFPNNQTRFPMDSFIQVAPIIPSSYLLSTQRIGTGSSSCENDVEGVWHEIWFQLKPEKFEVYENCSSRLSITATPKN